MTHPCDLCHALVTIRRYPARPLFDPWFACAECVDFIEDANPAGLMIRALLMRANGLYRSVADIRRTHESFWYTLNLRQGVAP